MNEFDQFIKHKLRVKHYVRYTDDFVIVDANKEFLERLFEPTEKFLVEKLKLSPHPKKIFLRKHRQGIDFLGYVILPHNIAIRTKTKKRMFRKLKKRIEKYQKREITECGLKQTVASYEGVLSHADAYRLTQELKNRI